MKSAKHDIYLVFSGSFFLLYLFLSLSGCTTKRQSGVTPWGTKLEADTAETGGNFSLHDIVDNGELIVLTMGGPETYYDYRGRGMGLQFLLCEKFAQKLGVSLRVEVCKDTAEMINRLIAGEGDIIAFQLPKTDKRIEYCGVGNDSLRTQWAVMKDNQALADSLNAWFDQKLIAETEREQNFLLSSRSVKRHVYSPFLNRSGGIISRYDHLFRRYAPVARWDWRLMAAQCYQESTFDPHARSWAGARGLMQIMPGTAAHLGLSMSQIHDPEMNIAAASRYIRELSQHFSDIPNFRERQYFVLAGYNGGSMHIRDAMALARKYGKDPHSWGDVSTYVLKLADAQYYHDPVVRHGYMRGAETVNYVSQIRSRYAQYCRGAKGDFGSYTTKEPKRAKRENRFDMK